MSNNDDVTAGTGSEEVLYRARDDLTVEQRPDEGFVIQDQLKNSFVQLGVAEYIVFRMFDGQSTCQDISNRLKEERDVIADPAQIKRLRDRLHEKQLILAPGEVAIAEDASVTEGNGLIQRLVFIDFGLAFDPDVFLTKLYHRIKYIVFRPAFFVWLAVMVALAAQIWLTNWEEIVGQASDLDLASSSFFIFYGCTIFSLFCHETAHGVSTKGFGGRVPKMGAFLYFFLVVFYTDVSASWMFRSKFHRLMVLFAGAIANLTLLALSTILWHNTVHGTMVNEIFFAMMLINAVAASFTLFPLLRGDGYYILSTAVDIPNLRPNSMAYTGALLKKRFVNRNTEIPKATDKEALVYVWFAPIQLLFFIGFFGVVATKTIAWLVGSYGVWGFWIVMGVALDRIARPVFNMIPRSLGYAASLLRTGFSQGPRHFSGLVFEPVIAGGRWLRRRALIIGLVAFPIVLLTVIPYPIHVSAPFEVVSTGPVVVRPKMGGLIEQYRVTTNDWVAAGDIVAVLDDRELRLQRATLEARLLEAQAELDELQAGFRIEERRRAALRVEELQARFRWLKGELEKTRALFADNIVTARQLQNEEAAVATARARLEHARQDYQLLDRGWRPEEIDMARARVERVQQQLAEIDTKLAWTEIRALNAGRVLTSEEELQNRLGTLVRRGDPVIEIASPEALVARVTVPEYLLSDVKEGLPVRLRYLNDPGIAYQGTVEEVEDIIGGSAVGDVGPVGGEQSPGTAGVLAKLGAERRNVPLGASGVAMIDCGQASVLGVLFHRAQRAGWVEFWSWW